MKLQQLQTIFYLDVHLLEHVTLMHLAVLINGEKG